MRFTGLAATSQLLLQEIVHTSIYQKLGLLRKSSVSQCKWSQQVLQGHATCILLPQT